MTVLEDIIGYEERDRTSKKVIISKDNSIIAVCGNTYDWVKVHEKERNIYCWLNIESGNFILDDLSQISVHELLSDVYIVN